MTVEYLNIAPNDPVPDGLTLVVLRNTADESLYLHLGGGDAIRAAHGDTYVGLTAEQLEAYRRLVSENADVARWFSSQLLTDVTEQLKAEAAAPPPAVEPEPEPGAAELTPDPQST